MFGSEKRRSLLRRLPLLKYIPDDFNLTDSQAIQKQVAISGKPQVNKKAIAKFLAQLKYPVSYLDFETFGTAIPLFDGLHPYQQVPFQFSLHIVRAPGTKPEHIMFLAEGRHDPRPAFMLKLRDAIPRTGSIVAFNASFELSRLKECCVAMPKFSPWLKVVEGRVIDLLGPFRSFDYYHPAQNAEAAWLNPDTQDPEKLLPLLKQYPSDEMEFYPVSREVNSPAVDKPSNIEPIKEGT